MADDAEFQQFASAAIAEVAAAQQPAAPTPTPEPPAPVAAPEPAKVEPAKEPEPAAPVEAKEEPKPDDVPPWKKAAEKEREKRAAKANETKLQQQLAAVEAKLARFEKIESALAKADSDPLGVGKALGLSYDKMTQQYIKDLERGDEPAPAKPNEEIQSLVQKIQQIEGLLSKQQQTLEQRANQEAYQAFVSEVKQTFEAKGDQFKLVKRHPQGPELVREKRAAHFRETAEFDAAGNVIEPGEIMPIDEACKLVEAELGSFLALFKDAEVAKVEAKPVAAKPVAPQTLSQDLRQGGVKPNEPHGDEVEQLLALKKALETQLNAQQG